MEVLYNFFAYLKKHKDMGKFAYYLKTPEVDESAFNINADWKDFYSDLEEELPPKMPDPRGNVVKISAFVDANHAGNAVTCRSHSGIIIFVQNAPFIWFSNRQNTVEEATFGSEIVALRICTELIFALHYKLRMFGVLLDRPADVFCDNHCVERMRVNRNLPYRIIIMQSITIHFATRLGMAL